LKTEEIFGVFNKNMIEKEKRFVKKALNIDKNNI